VQEVIVVVIIIIIITHNTLQDEREALKSRDLTTRHQIKQIATG